MRSIKRGLFSILLILALVFNISGCSSKTLFKSTKDKPQNKEALQIVAEAENHIYRLELSQARKLYEEKYDTVKKDSTALRSYADLEYYFYREFEKAKELVNAALKLEPENRDNYMQLGEIYYKWGKQDEAIKSYNKAVEYTAESEESQWNGDLEKAYYSLAKCYIEKKDDRSAISALEKAVGFYPYDNKANELLHRLYVKNEDYVKAYSIWKKDNKLMFEQEPFVETLGKWSTLYNNAIKDTTGDFHYNMGKLYSDMLLYDEACLEYEKVLAKDQSEEIKNKLNEVQTITTFREEVKSLFEEYYRLRSINGVKEESQMYPKLKPIYNKIAVLFPEVNADDTNTVGWIDSLNAKIEDKFQIRIKYFSSYGFGCHFGYILKVSDKKISQWGQEENLKVVFLKDMESNGLANWLSKGNGGVGGWNSGTNEVVALLLDSSGSLSFLDDEKREGLLKEAEKKETKPDPKDPCQIYYSPVLSNKLITKQLELEKENYKTESSLNMSFNEYFMKKVMDQYISTSIYVHEGQHAIDARYSNPSTWTGELDYRAKLSELAYGTMQFIKLTSLHDMTLGDPIKTDNHSMANNQIYKDIVEQIYKNSERYPEINTKKNIMLQLINLDESDIQEIAKQIFEEKY